MFFSCHRTLHASTRPTPSCVNAGSTVSVAGCRWVAEPKSEVTLGNPPKNRTAIDYIPFIRFNWPLFFWDILIRGMMYNCGALFGCKANQQISAAPSPLSNPLFGAVLWRCCHPQRQGDRSDWGKELRILWSPPYFSQQSSKEWKELGTAVEAQPVSEYLVGIQLPAVSFEPLDTHRLLVMNPVTYHWLAVRQGDTSNFGRCHVCFPFWAIWQNYGNPPKDRKVWNLPILSKYHL